uniref:BZIP domain-containing protein n=1 Tax=Plectus sambesii TaxID=2011161 RepID=A0A914X979_9BILA
MFHSDDSAALFAAVDADFADFSADFSAPLTAFDLGLQQSDQCFNRSNQGVWQCSNCSAFNVRASQRFVRCPDDGLKSCVKRADSVLSGFGEASPSSVPSDNASMPADIPFIAASDAVLFDETLPHSAIFSPTPASSVLKPVPASNEVPSSPDYSSSDLHHSSLSPTVHSSLYFDDDDAQDLYIKSVLGFSEKTPEIDSALSSPVDLNEIGRELDKWFEKDIDFGALVEDNGSSQLSPQESFAAVPSPAQIFDEIVSECQLIERRSNPSSPTYDAPESAAHFSPKSDYAQAAFLEDHYYTSACAPPSVEPFQFSAPSASPAPSASSASSKRKRAAGISLAELSADELTERKRQQNREAALRYRKKQKTNFDSAKEEVSQLEERNADLISQAADLESKIATLRQLIFDRVLDGKGSVPQ